MWPFKPKPWSYAGHEYIGVEGDSHAYLVTFRRGSSSQTRTYRFHARTVDQGKDEAKLVRFFTAEAARLEQP